MKLIEDRVCYFVGNKHDGRSINIIHQATEKILIAKDIDRQVNS